LTGELVVQKVPILFEPSFVKSAISFIEQNVKFLIITSIITASHRSKLTVIKLSCLPLRFNSPVKIVKPLIKFNQRFS
jgi:hypothetical protein